MRSSAPCLMRMPDKLALDKLKFMDYDKKGIYYLMQNEVEKMKIGVGAMSELLRMFYDSLIQQNFTPEQAIQLTSDYMKAVFGK